jgi:hypothetical protein
MAGRIDDFMTAEYDGHVIATARYCRNAVDDGCGGIASIGRVPAHPDASQSWHQPGPRERMNEIWPKADLPLGELPGP